jgi:ubiquinone/menaquinone biosynthesis C-methylase UbiE
VPVPDPAHRFDDSAAYERFMGRWTRAAGSLFIDWLAPPQGARWIDIGCGTGAFTGLIVDRCSPAEVIAVDPQQAQIEHARRQPIARRANFRLADATALPFADAEFDVVVSALAINFIPDRSRAMAEMCRVVCPRGVVAGYVWDFASDLSPSWPLRRGLHDMGLDVPQIPGFESSGLPALISLFEMAGLEEIAVRTIDVTASYPGIDEFCNAQTPSYSPTSKMIDGMTESDRARLKEIVRVNVLGPNNGPIEYLARAKRAENKFVSRKERIRCTVGRTTKVHHLRGPILQRRTNGRPQVMCSPECRAEHYREYGRRWRHANPEKMRELIGRWGVQAAVSPRLGVAAQAQGGSLRSSHRRHLAASRITRSIRRESRSDKMR